MAIIYSQKTQTKGGKNKIKKKKTKEKRGMEKLMYVLLGAFKITPQGQMMR